LAIICTPSSDNREYESLLSAVKLKLTLMQVRELEGGLYKCFNDNLDFVVDFSVARELKEVFDEELKTV